MRTNLVTNPSLETNTTGWAAIPGTGGTAAFSQQTEAPHPVGPAAPGSYFGRVAWSAATTAVSGGCSFTSAAVTAATVYTGQVYVRSSRAQTLVLNLAWYNSSSTLITTTVGTAVAVVAGTWTQLTNVNIAAPAGAVTVVLQVVAFTGGVNWASGDTLDVDTAMLEAATTVGVYFDGNVAGGYWTGTANASTSVQPNTTPTLTPFPAGTPTAYIAGVFTEMPPTIATINVLRTSEGRQVQVRGALGIYAVGGASFTDSEAPLGVVSTYQAQMFDSSGNSLGFTTAASATLDATVALKSYRRCLIHQPLKPALAIQATIINGASPTAAQITRTAPGAVYYPEGASVGTRIGKQRLGVAGMPFAILCDSAADADTFQAMFGSYTTDYPAIICIRTAPTGPRMPRVMFASTQPAEVRRGYNPGPSFEMSLDEVAPPSPGLVVPALRREDIDAAYTTRAAADAAYPTRLARDTDFTKAGLAGP